jgi:hypothetical protein
MPVTEKLISWQCPKFEASAEERSAWVEEQIEEGEGFLESQSSYKNLSRNLRIFDAIFDDKTKSTLISNGLKYDIRKFVETISEVREIGTYSSDATQFKPITELFNKVVKAVFLEAQFPRQVRKSLQYSTVMGRGYIWPKVKATNYGFGERQFIFKPLGPLDVVPVQMPDTNDVQDAYSNTIYEYMPIAEAHGRFPLFQSSLVPVSGISYNSRIQARRVDYAEKFRYGEQTRNWGNLYCEIRYSFIRDIRINNTGHEIPMGDPGTSWFYKVPSVGQDIFGGIRNGQPFMRPAMNEDCLIYPQLRLIITSRGMKTPMYDGPAFDWHGCMPAVQYDVDDWAWEAFGRSLVQDVGSIEVTKRKIERKMDQVTTTTLNPPLGYDRGSTGGPKIENFDIFEENVRAGLDGKPRDVLQSLLPEEVRITGEHFKFLEMLAAMRKEQLGINDLGNLAAMKLNLSGEQIDKALEPVGPIAKGIAAGMEASNAKIAYMMKFMVPQWCDTKRVIEYVGPDNITSEVLDFDPASLIPSHLPDEYVNGVIPTDGVGLEQTHKPSQYPDVERAKRLAKNIRLISVPSTLLKITQQAEQLKFLTLKRQNAPISWATVMKKLGVENYGEVKGNTEREKWQNEAIEELKFKVEEMKLMQSMGLDPGAAGGGGPGQGKGGGRPPTGRKSPKAYKKGGAGGDPRTGIKES